MILLGECCLQLVFIEQVAAETLVILTVLRVPVSNCPR